MLAAALVVAFISLWMAWPGLQRQPNTTPLAYSLRWTLFGLLVGSTLFLLYLFYGLRIGAQAP